MFVLNASFAENLEKFRDHLGAIDRECTDILFEYIAILVNNDGRDAQVSSAFYQAARQSISKLNEVSGVAK